LGDDAGGLGEEGHAHAERDVLPPVELQLGQVEPAHHLLAPGLRQQLIEHQQGLVEQPRHHHVGVGVVLEPGLVRVRVLLMELVRTHHACASAVSGSRNGVRAEECQARTIDVVAVGLFVVDGLEPPEAGNLEHHLGAVESDKIAVARHIVIVPDWMTHNIHE
jgi:hypothetical protein